MPVLGYWPIRGYGQTIRYLMHYAGQPFEEKRYYQKGPPDFDKSDWRDKQDTIGLDFPNLPYYVDEEAGVTLSQSKVILKYLARKHNLVGQTDEEINRQELLLFESVDFHREFFHLTYNPEFVTNEKLKEDYVQALPDKLQRYEAFLGDRPFFVGEKLNYADLNAYEVFYIHVVLVPSCLDSFPKLKAFMQRIEELPRLKEFMQSKDHILEPICSRAAFFSAGN